MKNINSVFLFKKQIKIEVS